MKELDIFELAETYEAHQKVIDKEVEEREKKAKELANATAEESSNEGTEETGKGNGEEAKD